MAEKKVEKKYKAIDINDIRILFEDCLSDLNICNTIEPEMGFILGYLIGTGQLKI